VSKTPLPSGGETRGNTISQAAILQEIKNDFLKIRDVEIHTKKG